MIESFGLPKRVSTDPFDKAPNTTGAQLPTGAPDGPGEAFLGAAIARVCHPELERGREPGAHELRVRDLAAGPHAARSTPSCFQAMTRDAMHELGLERDPTLRVSFPAAEEKLDPNCLESVELAGFLAAMRAHHRGLLGAICAGAAWKPRGGVIQRDVDSTSADRTRPALVTATLDGVLS